jgi:hypothetical protein
METTLSEFFTLIDKEAIERRMNKSEETLNENQELELLILNYQGLKKTKFAFLDDLPGARVLAGHNTEKPFEESTSTEALYKSNNSILKEK